MISASERSGESQESLGGISWRNLRRMSLLLPPTPPSIPPPILPPRKTQDQKDGEQFQRHRRDLHWIEITTKNNEFTDVLELKPGESGVFDEGCQGDFIESPSMTTKAGGESMARNPKSSNEEGSTLRECGLCHGWLPRCLHPWPPWWSFGNGNVAGPDCPFASSSLPAERRAPLNSPLAPVAKGQTPGATWSSIPSVLAFIMISLFCFLFYLLLFNSGG